MKLFTHLKSKTLNRLASIFIIAVAIASLNSCAKDNTTVASISGLTVVNASPTLGTYNVYLNTALVNTAPLPFTGTIPYFQITPGSNSLVFSTASSATSLLTKVVNLEADKAYSLFLIDKADKLDGLLITDDLAATDAQKALIRFINLSPDAGTLQLAQTGAATVSTDEAYKAYSPFSSTEAKTYSLELRDKATGTILTKLENVVLAAGKMYTIVAAGMVTPSANDQSLRIQVITNK
jgi:hypothetical protein